MARSRRSSRSRKSVRKSSRSRRSVRKSSRKPRVYRLTKYQFREKKLDECRKRSSEANCGSDPNCSWNNAKSYCYKGKQNIYAGPSLPPMF